MNRIIEVAVTFVKTNLSTVTIDEIKRIWITGLATEHLSSYREYFQINPTGLTKEYIQDVVTFSNALPNVLNSYNADGLQSLKDLVSPMTSSPFRNEFAQIIVPIDSLIVLENNLDTQSLQEAKNKVALINHATTKEQINKVVLVMESVVKAKTELSNDSIDAAIAKINELPNGSLKDRLLLLIGDYSF